MSSPSLAARALALVCMVLASGCIPDPPGGLAREARTEMPDTFGGEAPPAVAEGETPTARVDWREFFDDPHLVTLIEGALENNQELNIAVQEMIVVNSEVMARRGEIYPSLSGGVAAGLDRSGTYTSQGQSDEAHGVATDLQNYQIGLYASWEIDVWSRLRNQADAAQYRYLASAAGRNFMVTRLVAEIATRYYELLALDRQLAILNDNIALQEDSLRVVRLQQQAAHVTMLAVTRFEAQLLGFQSRTFDIRQRITATENQLNFLVGRFPQHVDRSTEDFLAITPRPIRTGVPTQLLENRPDVQQAELALQAAQLDVSAARAAFYPALRLDVGVGVRSFDITRLFSPESILYGLLAGLTAPLLNRSGLTADYYAANSTQMQAVLRYEQTILSAFTDVSTGLALLRNTEQSYALETQQVERLVQSVEISNQLFTAARADYLEVLTTRRDSLEAQMELVETKQRELAATVTLYQALGGGWLVDGQAPSDPEPMGAVP